MVEPRHRVWLLLDGVQMDVRELEKRSRELSAKIVQLRSFVAGLGLGTGPGPEVCEECGLGRGLHLRGCSLSTQPFWDVPGTATASAPD